MKTSAVFLQFLYRDCAILFRRARSQLLNYGLLDPFLLSICFGYIIPWIVMKNPDKLLVGNMFIGNAIWTLFPLAVSLTIDLLFDLEEDRFVAYQISILKPRLLLLERVIFATGVSVIGILFFFPVAKIILQDSLSFAHASYSKMLCMFILGAAFSVTFSMGVQLIIRSTRSIENLWLRFYLPFLTFAGATASWKSHMDVSSFVGYLALCNPLMHFTEGLRSAILGQDLFLPFWITVIVLLGATLGCFAFLVHIFKKRLDHV